MEGNSPEAQLGKLRPRAKQMAANLRVFFQGLFPARVARAGEK
jgi:hypothetical protein